MYIYMFLLRIDFNKFKREIVKKIQILLILKYITWLGKKNDTFLIIAKLDTCSFVKINFHLCCDWLKMYKSETNLKS